MSKDFTIDKIQKMFIRKMNKIVLNSLCKVGYHLYLFPLFLLEKKICINCLTIIEHEELKKV